MIMYLSGPMRGLPEKNHPLFNSVAAELRSRGHRVYNPAEYPYEEGKPFPIRNAFASYCVFISLEAEAICLLPGWENSLGASCEKALAENCGLKLLYWADMETESKDI